jgi:hypothetical protein
MPFSNLKRLLIISVLAASLPALAGAEEKKEGGAEGGAAKEGPEPEGSKEQKEYYEKTAKMNTLANRIEETEKKFQETVRAKADAKSTEEKQKCIKEMVELANQRNKDVDAYNKVKAELTYRYPYQGEKLNRHYQTQSHRTAEELENAGGLDDQLTRTKKIVEKKFAPFMEDEKPAAQPKIAKPAEEKPARLRLEK